MTLSLEGVTFLEHTADVGVDVVGPSPAALFRRAAAGMLALLRGQEEASPDTGGVGIGAPGTLEAGPQKADRRTHTMELAADGWPGLLQAWLRELLFLHETRYRDCAGAEFVHLTPTRLEARVETEPATPPVREIKGVTYHGLAVDEGEDGWRARVIFDV